MNNSSPLRHLPIRSALVCGLALRLVLSFLTPVSGESVPGVLSSYNDERAHGNYILHVQQTGSLPGQIESIQSDGALARGNFENYQPPLYYVTVAAVAGLFGANDLPGVIRVARLLGLLWWLLLALIFLRICHALNLSSDIRASGLIFLALGGVFVRFTSTAGNEPLFWVMAGALILLSIRIQLDGLRPWHWMTFAALACLALYTKLTAVLLLPLPLFCFHRGWNARIAVALAGMYCLVLVCVFPLWLRNLYTFGSLLPLNAGFGEPAWRVPNLATAVYAVRSFVSPWSEFWHGAIGMLFLLPALIFCGWSLIARGGWTRIRSQPVLSLSLLIAFASFLYLNCRYDQAEGRYLFSAWPALVLAFVGDARANWLLLAVLLLPYALFLIPLTGV